MYFAPLINASLAIQLHVIAAVLAFVLGGLVLFRRKGDRLHRLGGRVWTGLMLIVIMSSFFIHTIRLWGPWSPIHLVSIGTLVSLYRGVNMARLHQIAEHRRTMQSAYLGALIIAGLFTFLPGRLMHAVFFEGPSPMTGVAVAATIVAAILLFAGRGMLRVESGAAKSLQRKHDRA